MLGLGLELELGFKTLTFASGVGPKKVGMTTKGRGRFGALLSNGWELCVVLPAVYVTVRHFSVPLLRERTVPDVLLKSRGSLRPVWVHKNNVWKKTRSTHLGFKFRHVCSPGKKGNNTPFVRHKSHSTQESV